MKREKTKHKGAYKVGDTYYITHYVGPEVREGCSPTFIFGPEREDGEGK